MKIYNKNRVFIKRYLYKKAIIRPILRCVHSCVISGELIYEKAMDMFHSKPGFEGEYSDITAVVKTFERPDKLKRLIKSIKRTFPDLKIIIVDDSRKAVSLDDKNIKVIQLPYDSGVSAGRAAGLEQVKTTYVINLDDDFIFTRKTKLIRAIEYLDKNSNVDLVAGEVAYLPYYIRFDYTKHKLMDYSSKPIYQTGTIIDGLAVFEKCANFFIARTERLKSVGWDCRLKRLDHADFFTRARGKLTTVFDSNIELLHDQTHFAPNYLAKRHDYSQDTIILNRRYPKK